MPQDGPGQVAQEALRHLHAGLNFASQGRFQDAIASLRRSIALQPQIPETHNNLATVLHRTGDLPGAIASFQEAIRLAPNLPELHLNLALAFQQAGRIEDSIASCRCAIALRPNYAEAFYALAAGLQSLGGLDEAIAANQQSLAIRPDNPHALASLGNALVETGRLDEAIACFRRAASLPGGQWAASNVLQRIHYHPGYDAARILDEHRRWNHTVKHGVTPARAHDNDRSPGRRLRIGYVSPDFRNHVVGANMLPLFRNHDRGNFEIFCYANLHSPADSITNEFRSLADTWRDISKLSDEQAARLIRDDRVDILVDLAVHTAYNRLPVFASKPSPIQVSFAGYPATTGLETIDYRITDPYLNPPSTGSGQAPDESQSFSTEKLIRLPDSFWCYQPDSLEPQVNDLPATTRGFVTFGSLSSFFKINDEVLRLWAQVLLAVSTSRLLVLAPQGSARQRLLAALGREGVDPGRVEFGDRQSRSRYLQTYRRIDITLDTFPYNAHTTGLDSLWMGVPVVTLVGRTAVARAGWSQLNNLKLTELASHEPADFVRTAAALATDLPRLADLRQSLRTRMQQSPLMDAGGFARNIEAAYLLMWAKWIAR